MAQEQAVVMLACHKCGGTIPVPMSEVNEAAVSGRPIKAAHDVCPNEPGAPKNSYRVLVEIFETKPDQEEEKVASLGGEAEAGTFKDALNDINKVLGHSWEQVVQMADVIDQG